MAWAAACTPRSTIRCSKDQAEVDRQATTHRRRPARGGILWDPAAQGRGSVAGGPVAEAVSEVAIIPLAEILFEQTPQSGEGLFAFK